MWIPSEKESVIANKLQAFTATEFSKWRAANGKQGPTPPTSFKTNDMLEFHQITVDTYKYATYGEINPAIFQVVSFPFLYAVMYGDYGHGFIFFLLGAGLCLFEGPLRKIPSMKGLLVTRYFWLMMGFFACYNGLIYNEFFAINNDWFGTCYDVKGFVPDEGVINYKTPVDNVCVYPFGMDPSQALSTGYLTFTNNIKEKLAVIIAYFHLNLGIFINALNCIYFGKWAKLTFDIITGFLIFLGLIGYMIVLIYVKWWYPVDPYTPPPITIPQDVLSISTSPSIITLLIGDVMGLTGFAEPNDPDLLWFP